jgi:hypothetical protein
MPACGSSFSGCNQGTKPTFRIDCPFASCYYFTVRCFNTHARFQRGEPPFLTCSDCIFCWPPLPFACQELHVLWWQEVHLIYSFIRRPKFILIYVPVFYFYLFLIFFITQLKYKIFRSNAICKIHRYFTKIETYATRTEYKLTAREEMCDEYLLLDWSYTLTRGLSDCGLWNPPPTILRGIAEFSRVT